MYPTNNHVAMATKAALNATLLKFKHGCVIYDKRGNIISVGNNKLRKSKYGVYEFTTHAEIDAIVKTLVDDLRNYNLLVVRIGKTKMCNSKPCVNCLKIINKVGIKNIYYSDKNGEIKKWNG